MARLSDEREPYVVVVVVPKEGPGDAAVTQTVNGRVARLIAFLLDQRQHIESMRGALVFNLGPKSIQAEIRETFAHQAVTRSAIAFSGDPELPAEPLDEYKGTDC